MATLDDSPSLFSGQQWTDWAESVLPDNEPGKKILNTLSSVYLCPFGSHIFLISVRIARVCITGKPVHINSLLHIGSRFTLLFYFRRDKL